MNPKSATDSLMTISIRTIVTNFALYFNNGYANYIEVLPFHLKNRMLRLVTVSPRFWRNIDLNVILSALCNPTIKHINLTTMLPSDETLKIISVCRNLESLFLTSHLLENEGPYAMTTEGLINLFPSLKNLQTIRLTSCQQADDSVVESIAASCKKLSALDVGGCTTITDRALEALSGLENLESLRVYKTQISEEGINKLVSGPCGPKLIELRVDDCDNLNQRVLITLTKKCPNLEILTFHHRLKSSDGNDNNYLPPDDLDMTQLKQVMFSIPW